MTFNIDAKAIANFSGDSLAMLFGEISPNSKITTVVTIVATPGPRASSKSAINNTVAMEEHKIFTTLFPTKIVESKLS